MNRQERATRYLARDVRHQELMKLTKRQIVRLINSKSLDQSLGLPSQPKLRRMLKYMLAWKLVDLELPEP